MVRAQAWEMFGVPSFRWPATRVPGRDIYLAEADAQALGVGGFQFAYRAVVQPRPGRVQLGVQQHAVTGDVGCAHPLPSPGH